MIPINLVRTDTKIVIDEPFLRHGFTVVPNYLFGFKGLSNGAKLTFILLLKYAWQEGQCFPGVVRLAEHLASRAQIGDPLHPGIGFPWFGGYREARSGQNQRVPFTYLSLSLKSLEK